MHPLGVKVVFVSRSTDHTQTPLPLSVTPTADINDMKICYVLVNGSNATSDIFYFTIEDSGKAPWLFQILV